MRSHKKNVAQATDYPEVMSREEVARFLGLSIKTVETHTKNGLIPHKRLGSRFLYSKTKIMQWLESETNSVSAES